MMMMKVVKLMMDAREELSFFLDGSFSFAVVVVVCGCGGGRAAVGQMVAMNQPVLLVSYEKIDKANFHSQPLF